jgi:hypothetical protein
MNNFNRRSGTSISISGLTRAAEATPVLSRTGTHLTKTNHVVLQGSYVKRADGLSELVVSVDPASVERKLAIRAINSRGEGRSFASDTFADVVKSRR